jgi:hypothetical protein
MDLQQALAALDGHFEVIPVGLSQLSQEKIQHLAKRGFYVLDPLPPSQQAAQQAFTLALQGNVQGALNLLARDIGQQIAQRYATGREHIRTGALANELLRATWIARKG